MKLRNLRRVMTETGGIGKEIIHRMADVVLNYCQE